MMGFDAVKALGFTVVPVPALKDPAVIVEDHGVLLIRYDLDSRERADVVREILSEHGEGSPVSTDEYDIIRALGIEVIPSTSISRKALLLDGEDVALVRADLDDVQRTEIAEWLLEKALGRVIAP